MHQLSYCFNTVFTADDKQLINSLRQLKAGLQFTRVSSRISAEKLDGLKKLLSKYVLRPYICT